MKRTKALASLNDVDDDDLRLEDDEDEIQSTNHPPLRHASNTRTETNVAVNSHPGSQANFRALNVSSQKNMSNTQRGATQSASKQQMEMENFLANIDNEDNNDFDPRKLTASTSTQMSRVIDTPTLATRLHAPQPANNLRDEFSVRSNILDHTNTSFLFVLTSYSFKY